MKKSSLLTQSLNQPIRTNSDRPSWDEFFMMHAYLAATRSSCLHLNTGAAIVKDKRVIAMGYNGAPSGIKSSLDYGSCRKDEYGINFEQKGSGTCRGRHAEENAMSLPSRTEMQGAEMFTVYYPCAACAKSMVGNDISRVVYSKVYKDKDNLSQELFDEKGIEVVQLDLDLDKFYGFFQKLK